ncbi:peptidoglycan/xylan/chitin deacetylase (PgdA/CDA1 family) [Nocardiopsis sp. Huas11]|uniref:polysaccharide deacetylase family protein n=1 Tax=Nocardiopsis sp. Huas11 TaxID=2183912 RepID=UPI000F27B1E9|nr:polysaccharide deacetylase family protein [Nocardiopsis sp. Huas11]RKS08619.1 peptidoglycan/xylan/chitin deacetylase (PgdA/CDA1 family) [Nocardiopsis sp. Huas11]
MNETLSPQRIIIRSAVALGTALGACAALASPAAAAVAPAATDHVGSAVVGGLSGNPRDCAQLKCVALTFDDGPGEYTDEVLDDLAVYDAQATFYVLGSKVGGNTDILQRMTREGHQVGNHSWDHADLATLSADEVDEDMDRTNEAIREATGTEPTTMRPPYGSLDDTARSAIDQAVILWDVDTLDWESRDADAVTEVTMDETGPGSVVLFHDIHESTAEAVPSVLKRLHRQGYHFVTVDELFQDTLEPGDVYTDARL